MIQDGCACFKQLPVNKVSALHKRPWLRCKVHVSLRSGHSSLYQFKPKNLQLMLPHKGLFTT